MIGKFAWQNRVCQCYQCKNVNKLNYNDVTNFVRMCNNKQIHTRAIRQASSDSNFTTEQLIHRNIVWYLRIAVIFVFHRFDIIYRWRMFGKSIAFFNNILRDAVVIISTVTFFYSGVVFSFSSIIIVWTNRWWNAVIYTSSRIPFRFIAAIVFYLRFVRFISLKFIFFFIVSVRDLVVVFFFLLFILFDFFVRFFGRVRWDEAFAKFSSQLRWKCFIAFIFRQKNLKLFGFVIGI